MEFQFYQLIVIVAWAVLAYLFFVANSLKKKLAVLAVGVLLFVANPINNTQEGVASLERFEARQQNIPARVQTETKTFEQKQAEELKKLKEESKLEEIN